MFISSFCQEMYHRFSNHFFNTGDSPLIQLIWGETLAQLKIGLKCLFLFFDVFKKDLDDESSHSIGHNCFGSWVIGCFLTLFPPLFMSGVPLLIPHCSYSLKTKRKMNILLWMTLYRRRRVINSLCARQKVSPSSSALLRTKPVIDCFLKQGCYLRLHCDSLFLYTNNFCCFVYPEAARYNFCELYTAGGSSFVT